MPTERRRRHKHHFHPRAPPRKRIEPIQSLPALSHTAPPNQQPSRNSAISNARGPEACFSQNRRKIQKARPFWPRLRGKSFAFYIQNIKFKGVKRTLFQVFYFTCIQWLRGKMPFQTPLTRFFSS